MKFSYLTTIPYGTHRRILETFVSERFEKHFIIRLSGLFGKGLKKNIIYDFLHNNQIENIHSEATYQFYSLDSLSNDIQKVLDKQINIINFSTEPTSVKEVVKAGFDINFENKPYPNPPFYDIKTIHSNSFNQEKDYILPKELVLEKLKKFVKKH